MSACRNRAAALTLSSALNEAGLACLFRSVAHHDAVFDVELKDVVEAVERAAQRCAPGHLDNLRFGKVLLQAREDLVARAVPVVRHCDRVFNDELVDIVSPRESLPRTFRLPLIDQFGCTLFLRRAEQLFWFQTEHFFGLIVPTCRSSGFANGARRITGLCDGHGCRERPAGVQCLRVRRDLRRDVRWLLLLFRRAGRRAGALTE